MNIIDERNARTIYRKLKKQEYDSEINLSASKKAQTVRLLDEGMVVDYYGNPDFYLKKGTLRKYYESLSDDYEGSINLGHIDFASFPFILGKWTKKDLHLVDTGDGRQALDVDLRLDDDSFIVKELRRMPYTLGVSAEFTFRRDEKLTEEHGFEVLDGIFIGNFAIVGSAGNVNSSGINLALKGENMTVKDITAALGEAGNADLETINKKLGDLMGGAEEPKKEETTEETPEKEEEPAKEETEKAEPAQEKTLSAIAGTMESLVHENKRLSAEVETLKAQLSTKVKAEQEFIEKFKNLSVSLSTESVTDVPDYSEEKSVFTDGIGEF